MTSGMQVTMIERQHAHTVIFYRSLLIPSSSIMCRDVVCDLRLRCVCGPARRPTYQHSDWSWMKIMLMPYSLWPANALLTSTSHYAHRPCVSGHHPLPWCTSLARDRIIKPRFMAFSVSVVVAESSETDGCCMIIAWHGKLLHYAILVTYGR